MKVPEREHEVVESIELLNAIINAINRPSLASKEELISMLEELRYRERGVK